MTCAYFLFTFESIGARLLGPTMAIEQLVIVRSAAQFLIIMPFVLKSEAGLAIFKTDHIGLHLLRGLLSVSSLYLYFYSFGHLPLAAATAISFTKALFLVVLAQICSWRNCALAPLDRHGSGLLRGLDCSASGRVRF